MNYESILETDPKIQAWGCAQDVVKSSLKAPSTAKFPSYNENYITELGENKYSINAYVDSQNGFGAQIRTNFTVTLTLTEKGYKEGSVSFK